MMEKIILRVYKNKFWNVAEVLKSGEMGLTLLATINRFYSVDDKWIYIYDTVGGSGTGYFKGNLLQKIYIGNSIFETQID